MANVEEKRQPLPAGRYWIILHGLPALNNFDKWIKSNRKRASIEKTEAGDLTKEDGAFVIFNTTKAMKFDQQSFGFPSIAGPEIQSAADAGHATPKHETPSEVLQDVLDASKDALFSTSTVRLLLIGLLVYAFTQTNRR